MVWSKPCSATVAQRWERWAAPMSRGESVPGQMVAGVLPAAMLHEDEIVLLLVKPSLWFIVLTSFRFVVGVGLLGILGVRMLPLVPAQQVALLAVLVTLGRLVWALLVWTSHIYLLTNQRVVTIKGVINVTVYQASLKKIQRTTLYKPLPERVLGLGTIGFATAATTSFDSTWVMIPRPLQTHEQIVAAIQRLG